MSALREPLNEGTPITLTHIAEGYTKSFTIGEVCGMGGSSIVYTAKSKDGIRFRIKEFYPYDLSISRGGNGELFISEKDEFQKHLNVFRKARDLQIGFLGNDETVNQTAGAIDSYFGNNTEYTVMEMKAGSVLSEDKDRSLHYYVTVCLSVAEHIKKFHNERYLYLDLKPDNVFVYRDTPNMVMLFDFDSVVKLPVDESTCLSSTRNWAAPELKQGKISDLCIRTDFYSVGAMLFEKVTGRLPDAMDRSICHEEWEYDFNSKLFENVDTRVTDLLTAFFEKTLASHPGNRYQSDGELIEALKKLKKEADPEKPFLCSHEFIDNPNFVGRESELKDIHAALEKHNGVFLTGMGGIGKSELAKQYGRVYRNCYDTVVFGMYSGSLIKLITDDSIVHINKFSRPQGDKVEDYYYKKYRKLKELTNEKVLLIIDNFNTADDKLNDFFGLGAKVIFTTRNSFQNRTEIKVDRLGTMRDALKLFKKYCRFSKEERESVVDLIELFRRHTLMIELLAKLCDASAVRPSEMLNELKENGLSGAGKETVEMLKDGNLTEESLENQLSILFDLNVLDNGQRKVMMCLSVLPDSGISRNVFKQLCGLDDLNDVNMLVKSGWIHREGELISLHPAIAEVVYNKLHPDGSEDKCGRLFEALAERLSIKSIDTPEDVSFLNQISGSRYFRDLEILTPLDYDLAERVFSSLYDIGESEHTKKYAQKMLKGARKYCGKISSHYAKALMYMGDVLQADNDVEEAAKCFREAERIINAIPDIDNVIKVMCLSRLSDVTSGEEKMAYLNEAYELLRNEPGEEGNLATVCNKISDVFYEGKCFEEAEKWCQEAINILEQLPGKGGYQLGRCYLKMVRIIQEQRIAFDEVSSYYLKALSIFKDTFGEQSDEWKRLDEEFTEYIDAYYESIIRFMVACEKHGCTTEELEKVFDYTDNDSKYKDLRDKIIAEAFRQTDDTDE